jgi:hypothetical protein
MVAKKHAIYLLVVLLLASGVWYLARTATNTLPNTDEGSVNRSTTKLFTSKELGFSFEYPARFGVVNAAVYNGDPSGRAFAGNFEKCDEPGCVPLLLTFGAATNDFQAPREASAVESGEAWFKENGRYYYGSAADPVRREIPYRAGEIQAVNATGLILYGAANGETTPGELGANSRRAVFNLTDGEFRSLTFAWSQEHTPDVVVTGILQSIRIQ